MKKQFKKIYIEITNICNLSCPFCSPDKRKKEYMNIKNFEHILDKIKNYTDYVYFHVKGEPLIHPYINDFIELASSKGFQINITTNGTLIENLKTKKIRQINYSMQSTNDIERIREIVRKLRQFIKNTDIYLSLRLWSDESKNNTLLQEMLLDEFENLKSLNDIVDKKAIDYNIFLSIEEEFIWPDEPCENGSREGYCHALKDHIAILVDGTVVPCCLDHKGIINLGNIYDSNLKEILDTARVKNITTGFKNRKIVEELCKNCNFKNRF